MHRKVLGKKQREDNKKFQYVWNNISEFVSKEHLDKRITETKQEIQKVISGKRVGYAWSGGKDSVALKFFMDELGVTNCVMGMTHDLEYPEFLRFVTENMPHGLEIYNAGHTLEWLSNNLEMLFPKNSNIAAKWFKSIQHKAQIYFYRKNNLDLIMLGRRKSDSNYVGKGSNIYYNGQQKVWRYSPLSNWTHEEVLALMRYYYLPVAPFYSWVNGWVVGSGCWAARQWTGSIYKGWQEVYSIDKSVVQRAATKIDSAQIFLNTIK